MPENSQPRILGNIFDDAGSQPAFFGGAADAPGGEGGGGEANGTENAGGGPRVLGNIFDESAPAQPAQSAAQPPVNPTALTDPQEIEAAANTPGSNFMPSMDQVRSIYDHEQNRTWPDKVSGFVQGGLNTLGGMAKTVKDSVSEAMTPSLDNLSRVPSSMLEGALRATAQDYDLVRRASRGAYDMVRDLNATPEEKFQHFAKRFYNNLWSQRAAQRGADDKGNITPEGMKFAEPLPALTDVSSFALDPLMYVPVADALGPVAKFAPKLARAIPGVAKAADLLDQAKSLPGKVIPGALEGAGNLVKRVSSAPEEAIAGAAEKYLPDGTAETLARGADVLTTAGLLHGGALGAAAKILKSGQVAGAAIADAGTFLRHYADTVGDSFKPRLLQLAQNAEAPEWVRAAAGRLHDSGLGTAAQVAGDFASSAKHGALTGAALSGLTAENPEEAGQMTATGAAFGATVRGVNKLTGADARMRELQNLSGALRRFYDYLAANGTPDEVISKIKTDPALLMTRVQMAAAKDLFGNQVSFRFLSDADFKQAATNSGQPGGAAFYDPLQKAIVLNVDDQTNRFAHEIPHAIAQAAGADGEARLTLDAILGPERIEQFGNEYASRMVQAELRAQAADPGALTPEDLQARTDQMKQKLDATHGGNKWIYDELYAEAGYGALTRTYLPDMLKDSPWYARLARSAREKVLEAISPSFDTDAARDRMPSGRLFSDAKIYEDPSLRRMFYDHVRKVFRFGTEAGMPRETREGEAPGAPLPDTLKGKHPASPLDYNPVTKRMENEHGYVDANGNFRPYKPREMVKRDNQRAREVRQVFESKPVKPAGDTSPEVAPRRGLDGRTEMVGTRISDDLAKLPMFGETALKNARLMESLFGTGKVAKLWYWAAARAENWGAGVARQKADVRAQEIEFAPYLAKVDSKGHVLFTGLSLNAVDRKLAKWSQKGQLALWNDDPTQFRADLSTYLKNHAEGRRGAEGLSGNAEAKRDKLNTFVIGDNRAFHELNPLRDTLRGDEKKGVIRSLRLDRMGTAAESDKSGWATEWEKKVKNFSPDTGGEDAKPETESKPDSLLYSPGVKADDAGGDQELRRVPGRKLLFKPELDNGNISIVTPSGQKVGSVWFRSAGKRAVELEHLDIDPKYHRQGLGEALLREANRNIRQLYPDAQYYTGNATSQGVVRLMRRVFGSEVTSSDISKLPKDSPADWMETNNRSKVRFKIPADETKELPRPRRGFQYSPEVEAKMQRAPNEEVRRVAEEFMRSAGRRYQPWTGYQPVDEARAKQIADAYEAAAHDPNHPEVKAAYDALLHETKSQWDAITASGVKMEPWTREGQPYQNSAEMRQDVAENKHLWFFPTEAGFGEDVLHAKNPLLQPSGVEVNGRDLPYNDLFRAVHDYFGHAKEGYEFGPRGEYNAYLAHSRMFSDEARPAMAAETLGQNSWVNYGPHLRDADGNIPKKGEPGFVPVTERPFAEQKTALLPKDLVAAATVDGTESPKVQFSPEVREENRLQDAQEAVRAVESPQQARKLGALRDKYTGVMSFLRGDASYESLRETIRTRAAYQTMRNLVVEVLRSSDNEHYRQWVGTLTRKELDRRLAKSTTQNDVFIDASYDALNLLHADEARVARMEQTHPRLAAALKRAKAALPIIPDSAPLVRAARFQENYGDLKRIGIGSEGVVFRARGTGVVYKFMEDAPNHTLHLSRVDAPMRGEHGREYVGAALALTRGSLFDAITKLERQSRFDSGLPVEILGITGNDDLIVKMPEMERPANREDYRGWLDQVGAADPGTHKHESSIAIEAATHNQPFIQDRYGNWYATSDLRETGEGYPNLMVDKNGRVMMTDVNIRPIDQRDLALNPWLRAQGFEPAKPDKILYSPGVDKDGTINEGEKAYGNNDEEENQQGAVRGVPTPVRPRDGAGGVGRFSPPVWRDESGGAEETGRRVLLRHWSQKPGLSELDPAYHGTGIPGEEAKRRKNYPELYVPRLYFGNEGYQKEGKLGPHLYHAEVDPGKIYDYVRDRDGLMPTGTELEHLDYSPLDAGAFKSLYEYNIKKAGYQGYTVPSAQVTVLFEKTPVKIHGEVHTLPITPEMKKSVKKGGPLFSPNVPGPDEENLPGGAVSPNIEEGLKLKRALRMTNSPRHATIQRQAEEVDKKLGLKSVHHGAVGAWQDGAENTLYVEYPKATPQRDVLVSLAMKAMIAQQKAFLNWEPDKDGPDRRYTMTVPKTVASLEQVAGDLEAHGIPFYTLGVDKAGKATKVLVIDFGGGLEQNIERLSDKYEVPNQVFKINATLRGDTSEQPSRARARRDYLDILRAAKKEQGH